MDQNGTRPPDNDIDAFISASRAIVALAVASLAELDDRISLTQFRALVVLDGVGTMRAADLADRLGTSASSVTRMCDRLVADSLLRRMENPSNRREVLLTVTAPGSRLVERVLARRRLSVQRILDHLNDGERAATVRAFKVFAEHAAPLIDAQVVHEWPVL
ncbi:MAG: MarR family winged helix-turn-helix transcriptional regulator [Jatrophihabitans sp.]|uniref:MarR family winged helix-turn-helix transcriptional regulator n=1 Tax=Jatrophihabitans sp. TaxID=1932789 RepID=UPI00390FC666